MKRILLLWLAGLLLGGLTGAARPAAAATSVASGRWSSAATWAEHRVPVAGETVTVAAGHEILFDTNMSGWTQGLGALTIQGSLSVDGSRSTALKMAGNITGAGALLAGSPERSLPREHSFVLQFMLPEPGTGVEHYYIANLGKLGLYAYQPEPYLARLKEDAAKGATTLRLEGALDVRPGEQLHLIQSYNNLERRTVRGYDAVTRVVTLTAPLDDAKAAGSRVVLLTRNIRLLGHGKEARWLIGGGHDYYVRAEATNAARVLFSGIPVHASNHEFAGAFYEGTGVLGNGTGFIISGTVTDCDTGCPGGGGEHVVTGHLIGCTHGLNGGVGTTLLGEIDRCMEGARGVSNAVINGTISNVAYALVLTSARCLEKARFENCGVFSVGHPEIEGFGARFQGKTRGLPSKAVPPGEETIHVGRHPVLMWDVDGRAGRLQSSVEAGNVTTDETVHAPGRRAPTLRFDFINDRMPVFLDLPVTLTTGTTLTVQVRWRQDRSGMRQAPAVQILAPGSDPLYGGRPLAEAVLKDTREWQTVTLRRSADTLQRLSVRIIGRNTGGSLWADVDLQITRVR